MLLLFLFASFPPPNVMEEGYEQVRAVVQPKPRTYRQQARREYLNVTKQRQVRHKTMRKAIRNQLGYVKRNLAHIDALVAVGALLSALGKHLYRKLLVIAELYRQQQAMYDPRQHRIDDRIVRLSQPHIRPMVRGKAGTPVEFGAKFSASCVNGQVLLDPLSWDIAVVMMVRTGCRGGTPGWGRSPHSLSNSNVLMHPCRAISVGRR